jgi:hypothetical protein
VRRVALVLVWLGLCGPAAAGEAALDALVAAYPDFIAGYDERDLILKSGARIPLSDGITDKTPEQRLDHADIRDEFVSVYPLGPTFPTPGPGDDPGRARNRALFDAMYGDCQAGAVTPRLRPVRWLPGGAGGIVQATTVNGVADRLEAVGRELAGLPATLRAYAEPSAGTYNCRLIAGTGRLSMHAYGAAIDLNVKYSDYWRWSGAKKETDPVTWKNRMPMEIVAIFEKHGFIWGGKWRHFDTMHFEYRPEILAMGRPGGGEPGKP